MCQSISDGGRRCINNRPLHERPAAFEAKAKEEKAKAAVYTAKAKATNGPKTQAKFEGQAERANAKSIKASEDKAEAEAEIKLELDKEAKIKLELNEKFNEKKDVFEKAYDKLNSNKEEFNDWKSSEPDTKEDLKRWKIKDPVTGEEIIDWKNINLNEWKSLDLGRVEKFLDKAKAITGGKEIDKQLEAEFRVMAKTVKNKEDEVNKISKAFSSEDKSVDYTTSNTLYNAQMGYIKMLEADIGCTKNKCRPSKITLMI